MANKQLTAQLNQQNQLPYYLLFFFLGAIFATAILAINISLTGRVIDEPLASPEDGVFRPSLVGEAVLNVRADISNSLGRPDATPLTVTEEAQGTLQAQFDRLSLTEQAMVLNFVEDDLRTTIDNFYKYRSVTNYFGTSLHVVWNAELGQWEVIGLSRSYEIDSSLFPDASISGVPLEVLDKVFMVTIDSNGAIVNGVHVPKDSTAVIEEFEVSVTIHEVMPGEVMPDSPGVKASIRFKKIGPEPRGAIPLEVAYNFANPQLTTSFSPEGETMSDSTNQETNFNTGTDSGGGEETLSDSTNQETNF